jgi:hypothetical protein
MTWYDAVDSKPAWKKLTVEKTILLKESLELKFLMGSDTSETFE